LILWAQFIYAKLVKWAGIFLEKGRITLIIGIYLTPAVLIVVLGELVARFSK
jgi:hypothetical protein